MSELAIRGIPTRRRRSRPWTDRPQHFDADSVVTWIAARFSIAVAGSRSRGAMSAGRAASRRMQDLMGLSDAELTGRRAEVRVALRTKRPSSGDLVEGLAIAGEFARRTLNLTP